jgi:hypothetical protein
MSYPGVVQGGAKIAGNATHSGFRQFLRAQADPPRRDVVGAQIVKRLCADRRIGNHMRAQAGAGNL